MVWNYMQPNRIHFFFVIFPIAYTQKFHLHTEIEIVICILLQVFYGFLFYI